ncbi:hypothetical protein D3C85_1800450 [compost metagenome]
MHPAVCLKLIPAIHFHQNPQRHRICSTALNIEPGNDELIRLHRRLPVYEAADVDRLAAEVPRI